jgi:hypothetical protein
MLVPYTRIDLTPPTGHAHCPLPVADVACTAVVLLRTVQLTVDQSVPFVVT